LRETEQALSFYAVRLEVDEPVTQVTLAVDRVVSEAMAKPFA